MRLKAEEKIIFKVHSHWLYIFLPELILVILGFLVLGFAFLTKLPYWILAVFVILWSFPVVIVFLEWLSINYYLTNLRLIEERGIIGKRIMFVPLNKVQDITCKFGILGRIFGFGDLEIESAGAFGKIVFNFLPQPRKLKEEINRAILEFKANKTNIEVEEAK
jgi:uncharacterized membrane protein YdbT with pleckstrin-like domain